MEPAPAACSAAEMDASLIALVDGDKFVMRNKDLQMNVSPGALTSTRDMEQVSREIGALFENKLRAELGFEEIVLEAEPDAELTAFDDDDEIENSDDENSDDGDTSASTADNNSRARPRVLASPSSTSILASPRWRDASKLLIMTNNGSGSLLGIWSRSLCLQKGLRAGSAISYVEEALQAGYEVLLLRPNRNYYTVGAAEAEAGSGEGVEADEGAQTRRKRAIPGSATPELHAMLVWDQLVSQALRRRCSSVALLGYGHGASLCHLLFTKAMLAQALPGARARKQLGAGVGCCVVHSLATIEASTLAQDDDSADVKDALKRLAVNFEISASHARGVSLAYRAHKLGVSSVSLGLPVHGQGQGQGQKQGGAAAADLVAASESADLARSAVFAYFQESYQQATARQSAIDADDIYGLRRYIDGLGCAGEFLRQFAEMQGLAGTEAVATEAPTPEADVFGMQQSRAPSVAAVARKGKRGSILAYFFPSKGLEAEPVHEQPSSRCATPTTGTVDGGTASEETEDDAMSAFNGEQSTGVQDFELLQLVGRGAFGKVILVRKKTGLKAGMVFAMKVLSKTFVIANGQVRHCLGERAILQQTNQPFIVHLRFAFQSDKKLYLVTDYYNGGNLLMHLSQHKTFTYEQTVFYAAEILSALEYLHSKNIIYRDLKLENLMMDHHGHLALIDFGLSKHNFVGAEGASTFCGTSFYLAPEIIKGQHYGFGVDYWALGVLIYEMLRGRSPYYDSRGKKVVFMKILRAKPSYNPDYFPPDAVEVCSGLMRLDQENRLGSKRVEQATALRRERFFATIDFDALSRKELQPPFVPDVSGPEDTRYVGKSYTKLDPYRESSADPELEIKAAKRVAKNPDQNEFCNMGFTYDGEK